VPWFSAARGVRERGELLLAQASVRERELAIRSALGAARGRLIRHFLTEAFLFRWLAAALAYWELSGPGGIVALAPGKLARLDSVSISIPVLGSRMLSTASRRPRGVHRRTRDIR